MAEYIMKEETDMNGVDCYIRKGELIRCKDCRWYKKERGWHGIEYTVCKLSPINRPIREEDDFCSHAERREEGE